MVNTEGSIDPNYSIPRNQSPVIDHQDITTGFGFDAQNERGVIPAAKIKNFSFNQGQGGTLTLGGPNDGNGVLFIKNSTGGTIVKIDSNSMVINNISGLNVVDSIGLNSITTFPNDYYFDESGVSTTSETYVDVPNSDLSTLHLDRATNVFIFFSVWGQNDFVFESPIQFYDSFYSDGILNMSIVGIPFTEVDYVPPEINDVLYYTYDQAASQSAILTLDAGDHNFKLQYSNGGIAGTTMYLTTYHLGYIVLGA